MKAKKIQLQSLPGASMGLVLSHSCCSEEGMKLSASVHCTVRSKVSILACFPILHCYSVLSNCFALPKIVFMKIKGLCDEQSLLA